MPPSPQRPFQVLDSPTWKKTGHGRAGLIKLLLIVLVVGGFLASRFKKAAPQMLVNTTIDVPVGMAWQQQFQVTRNANYLFQVSSEAGSVLVRVEGGGPGDLNDFGIGGVKEVDPRSPQTVSGSMRSGTYAVNLENNGTVPARVRFTLEFLKGYP